MRVTFALIFLTLSLGACQTPTLPAATQPGAATPPGPMDNVTNPMNQPRPDRTGALH